MTCRKCGKGWPEAKISVYESQSTKVVLCDTCLFAEIPVEQAKHVFAPGSRFYVGPDGSESALPSYAT